MSLSTQLDEDGLHVLIDVLFDAMLDNLPWKPFKGAIIEACRKLAHELAPILLELLLRNLSQKSRQ